MKKSKSNFGGQRPLCRYSTLFNRDKSCACDIVDNILCQKTLSVQVYVVTCVALLLGIPGKY